MTVLQPDGGFCVLERNLSCWNMVGGKQIRFGPAVLQRKQNRQLSGLSYTNQMMLFREIQN